MTVKELIEELQKHDENLPAVLVSYYNDDGSADDAGTVENVYAAEDNYVDDDGNERFGKAIFIYG